MRTRGTWAVWALGILAVILVGMGNAAVAGPADFAKLVPAGHEAFIYVDVARARSSKLYLDIKPKLFDENTSAGLAMIQQLTGMKVPDDIDVVAASGKIAADNQGCLYVQGRWDRQRILSFLAMNPSYTEIPKPGGKVYGFVDEKKGSMNYLAFLDDHLAVIGNKNAVEACVDGPSAKGPSWADNPSVKACLADNVPNPVAIVIALRPAALPANLANLPSLQNLRSVFLEFLEGPEVLTLVVRAEADSQQMAARWLDVVRGAIAVGQIQNKVPRLAEIANQTTAAQNGSVVEVKAQVKTASASGFLQQKIAEGRANQPSVGGRRVGQGQPGQGEKPVPPVW